MPVPALGQDSLLLIGLSPLVSLSPLRGLTGSSGCCLPFCPFSWSCSAWFRTVFAPIIPGLQKGNTLLSKPSITRVSLCPASLVILLLFQSRCNSRENESIIMTIATPKTRAPVTSMSREKLEPSNQTGRFGTQPPCVLTCDSAVSFSPQQHHFLVLSKII